MAATLLPTIVKPMTATCCPRRLGTGVGAQDHVGVEHRDEPVEVPRAAGGEERVDDLALCGEARIRHRGGSAHTAPRAAGELPRGLRRAVDHRRDLVERNGEDVVEHESETLGRAERLENDQQGQPDRVGHEPSCSGSGASAGRMIGSGMCADLATALLDAVEPDSGLHREVAYVAN